MSTQRGDLVAQIAKAATLSEQARLVSELDAFDQRNRAAHQATRDLDLAATIVSQTLSPVRTHEMHTIASDWIGDFEPEADGNAHQASIAKAAMWFGRVSAEVKADREEFGAQAEGFMRREASQYGEDAPQVYEAGLTYLGFLHRQAASGLDQIQQTIDPNNSPKTTPLDPMTFDNFAPEVHPINEGVTGTESSENAPLMQLIEGEGSGQGQPEKPGGHYTSEDLSNSYSEVPAGGPADNSSGPLYGQASLFDHGSVAIAQTYTMDDFRREGASGLDQIQQTIDPNNQPKVTGLPVDVQFPWLIGPDAYGNGGKEPEQDEDVAQSVASRRTAGEPQFGYGSRDKQIAYSHGYGHGQADKGKTSARKQASDNEYKTHCSECGKALGIDDTQGLGVCSSCERDIVDRANKRGRYATRKQADMFGNSDAPHAVPGPSPANNLSTRPNESADYAQGYADAQDESRPTFADNSAGAPSNVSGYAQGYSDGVKARERGDIGTDLPVGAGGDNGQGYQATSAKVSDRFVKAASRSHPDFTKGYGYAASWKPGTPLVTLGSAEFESGLYAGMADNAGVRQAFEAAHRRQARKDARFAQRMQVHASYTAHLAAQGIDVQAATSTDLDTMDASASPSPTGQTPINGPGTVPPLAGQADPAAPGGPSPYNGAEPLGAPVVPTGPAMPTPGAGYINDIPGGPADGNNAPTSPTTNPAAVAFRRQVQASLLQQTKKG